MTSVRARRASLLLGLVLLVVLSGCGLAMPTSGPINETKRVGSASADEGFELDPRPPRRGANPSEIVSGFLDAMQATPLQTTTARQYLSSDLASSWNPQQETITYEDRSTPRGRRSVTVNLVGANHIDGQGSWMGPLPASERRLGFSLVREQGQWRISRAPDALVVPVSWFESRFTQASLYYFDPTGRILVPTPVFIPRGDQFATMLVRDLLRPPERSLSGIVRTFLPSGVGEGLSVPVSDAGVADLELTGSFGEQSRSSVRLMFAQLAWTLRQDPSVRTIRLTIDGRTVTPGDAGGNVSVEGFDQYDPTGHALTGGLWALRNGVVVTDNGQQKFVPVAGRWASTHHGVRSLAVDLPGDYAAAVSDDGRRVLLGSLYSTGTVRQTPVQGTDLLRPAWDYAERLWLVDRTRAGARVSYLEHGQMRRVRVPGITGRDVTSFLISRDGTRLVAALRRGGQEQVVVSRLRSDTGGHIIGAAAATSISDPAEGGAPIEGLAWHSTTSIVVLQQLPRTALLRVLPVDGSAAAFSSTTFTVGARVDALVGSPSSDAALSVKTASGRLIDLSGHTRVLGGRDITSITYAG